MRIPIKEGAVLRIPDPPYGITWTIPIIPFHASAHQALLAFAPRDAGDDANSVIARCTSTAPA